MHDPKNDSRLIAISDLLAQYSLGNFDNPDIELSDDLDEIDSIISGVNMLGQELEATTVSRDFFADIYNTVSNILIVTDSQGIIQDANKTTFLILKCDAKDLIGQSVFDRFDIRNQQGFLLELRKQKRLMSEQNMIRSANDSFPVYAVWSCLFKSDQSLKGFLLVADDLTDKKNKEREILRNIMETEERERARVADDLHDSLGQELASIRMLLAGITYQMKNGDIKERLTDCTELIDTSIQNIRSICFDLIPSALEGGELLVALRQMMEKLQKSGEIYFSLKTNTKKTCLSKNRQIALYRVIQEFIHNSMKHAECSEVEVDYRETNGKVLVQISDNGKGFDMNEKEGFVGRGMSTMLTRIEAVNGTAVFFSDPGQGTLLQIKL